MVFQSPKKHRIIAIKKLLAKNNIPVTSVKLYIYVQWTHGGRKGGGVIMEERERRDELNVPVEDFTGKLNDAQTFELYTDEKHEDIAIGLIEECDIETFFDDCIFKSNDYDEIFEIYSLLNKHNIPCDDIFPNIDNYLLFVDPENKDKAIKLIEGKDKNETITYEYQNTKSKELFVQEHHGNKLFKYILPLIIISCLLLLRIDNESIMEIIIKKIGILIENK